MGTVPAAAGVWRAGALQYVLDRSAPRVNCSPTSCCLQHRTTQEGGLLQGELSLPNEEKCKEKNDEAACRRGDSDATRPGPRLLARVPYHRSVCLLAETGAQ
jgi:hypothetical protein